MSNVIKIVPLNAKITPELVLARTMEAQDFIESICVICKRKDGSVYLDWSQQALTDLAFKQTMINNLVNNFLNAPDETANT